MNFHVGMQVVCVCALHGRYGFEIMPVKGEVYTIRGFYHLPEHYKVEDKIGLWLVEIHNQIGQYTNGIAELSFAASAFRPVVTKQTYISIFTKMLAPTPKEKEPA